MNISMRLMPLPIRRPITILIPITLIRIPSNLAFKIRDRVLQTIQLATQHIKLRATKRNRPSTRRRSLQLRILRRPHKRRRRILVNILALVGWMIRAQFRMISVSTRLTRPRKIASVPRKNQRHRPWQISPSSKNSLHLPLPTRITSLMLPRLPLLPQKIVHFGLWRYCSRCCCCCGGGGGGVLAVVRWRLHSC